MARTGGSSTQRQVLGNPPPSTIAAQIVNNASNVKPFPELLREFLRNPIIDDLDPELNVQFISTIVEAGLDNLHYDNPFASHQDKDLAIDSLRAIKISIWQIPQLLTSSRKRKEKEDISDPPVFLWLFPKILGLLDPKRFRELQDDLQDLLTSFLEVLGGVSGSFYQEASAAQLYRSCAISTYCATESLIRLSTSRHLHCACNSGRHFDPSQLSFPNGLARGWCHRRILAF